ncbi:peptidoglycan DD-metalloendopeptidase family protein [Baekduia alba]|uniref:peptidoglycan DD-metalloendopeptidase family protein n=1 Tax=Baekduia alba TaxID=2997333 RepID=UPI00233FC95D|nr:peptidoglycan DD-metalloendopeptidase family protein [Baekduia alba]
MALVLGALGAPGQARAAGSGTAALQVALLARGLYAGTVDGLPGPATRTGVLRLQRRARLVVDGVAGAATRRALGWRGRPLLGARALGADTRGWDVAQLQFLLGRAGFPSGAVDGVLGARSAAALRRFQAWARLAVDGRAGPGTLAALRRAPPTSPLRLRTPVSAPVGDRFGPRGSRFHSGLDYVADTGAPVAAAGAGCVASAGWDPGGYGNLVVLAHRFGVTSWYAHLSALAVRPGACVAAGTVVGRVGATGRATGPHLHFELRLRGAAIDPRGAVG